MTNRSATANWNGSLKEGSGSVALGAGAIEAPISFASRFEEGEGTNPALAAVDEITLVAQLEE